MAFTFPSASLGASPYTHVRLVVTGGDDSAAGIMAWQNPESCPILVTDWTLRGTSVSTGACAIRGDVRPTPTSTNNSDGPVLSDATVPNALSPMGMSFNDSSGNGFPAGLGTGNGDLVGVGEYLVHETDSGASAGFVGVVDIIYRPLN